MGGTIAYEIANQLKNRGELILGVYIIDTKAIDPAVWEKIEVLKTPNNFRKNLKVLGISDAEIPQLLKLNSIEEKLLLTYTLPKSKDIAIILMQALKFETSSDKEVDQLNKKIDQLTRRPNNGWDAYVKNVTVYKFDATHYSIMKEKHLKRIVSIIEKDMNNKIKSFKNN
nr:thioesterase domain-containing protein [Coxiella burnetii]